METKLKKEVKIERPQETKKVAYPKSVFARAHKHNSAEEYLNETEKENMRDECIYKIEKEYSEREWKIDNEKLFFTKSEITNEGEMVWKQCVLKVTFVLSPKIKIVECDYVGGKNEN